MIERTVARALQELDLAGRSILVAVSGGVDSTVLLHVLARLAPSYGLRLAVGHVNHGLRGAESDADEAAVRALAGDAGLAFRVQQVAPETLRVGRRSRSRPTLQEAARRLRYDALFKMAAECGADRVATAHTLDDQAETVLLRLFRGAGPDGLGGIPEQAPDGRVVRPLLRVSRAEIERTARTRRLTWREDASNQDPAYARTRLRARLADLGEALNPRWLRAIGDLAEAQRRDSDWIALEVAKEARRFFRSETQALRIERRGWPEVPEPLARRLAREGLRSVGGARDVSRVHLERMLAFLRAPRTGARLELPGDLELRCEADAFRLGGAPVRPKARC